MRALLLVDATPSSRRTFRTAFARRGWRVFSAIDSVAAAQVCTSEELDAVLVVGEPGRLADALLALQLARRWSSSAVRVLVAPQGPRVLTDAAHLVVHQRSPRTVHAFVTRHVDMNA